MMILEKIALNQRKKNLHYQIIDVIKESGQSFDKKHGNWIILKLPKNQFLQLDTWNKSIYLKKGNGDYNQWKGFDGELIKYFGLDFGGFESHASIGEYIIMLGIISNKHQFV